MNCDENVEKEYRVAADVTTEDRTVDGLTYTFNQNTSRSMYLAASAMVENGASLLPGYNLSGTNATKWAWTMRYQSGWTTGSAKPDGLPYIEGCYPYGYEAGSANPVYLEELANAGGLNDQ